MKTAILFAILGGMGWANLGVDARIDSVRTYRYSESRSGANTHETFLTRDRVASDRFGKLWSYPVEGRTYAQPLFKAGVATPGKGTHDLLFVATSKNQVYAFDANSNSTEPVWRTSFNDPERGITPVPTADLSGGGTGEVGITSTPVLDLETQTMYVVAQTKQDGKYFHHLHALDYRTGREKENSPVRITATVPGTGDMSVNGQITYTPLRQFLRAGLALVNGVVYIGVAAWDDVRPYHGWIFGYDAKTLARVRVRNITPSGGEGSIWMSGGAPAVDSAGNLFVATGNGDYNGRTDWADSILRFQPTGSRFELLDSYTPDNQQLRNDIDLDLGSGGVVLVPKRDRKRLLVQVAKGGDMVVLDQARLGGYTPQNRGAWQYLPKALNGTLFSTPTYFANKIYVHAVNDNLKVFSFNGDRLRTTPIQQNTIKGARRGGTSTLASNGAENAILFEVNGCCEAQELIAYDANNVSRVLYRSSEKASDRIPAGTKFVVPVVINGKVYVGSDDRVYVYGVRD